MLDFILKPWPLIVLFVASQLNREQQRMLEYLRAENQVLREKLGKKRILLNDDQRRRLAKENPTWGYTHIEGALLNLGITVSDTTAKNILREHEIEPAPERQRKTSWKTFLKTHWEVLGAVDFTTIEVWTRGGLVTFYILVAMRVATRRIEIAGIMPNPEAAWVQQMGRFSSRHPVCPGGSKHEVLAFPRCA